MTAPPTEPIIIARSGDRDLKFSGVLLGRGTHTTTQMHRTALAMLPRRTEIEVLIYRTTSARYVVAVHRQQSVGDVASVPVCDARVYETARDLLNGLHTKKRLPPASKEAWTNAAANDEDIAALLYEEV